MRQVFKGDNYSRETTIQGRKLLISSPYLLPQLFKGDNYSREETIRGNTVVFFTYGEFQNFHEIFALLYEMVEK